MPPGMINAISLLGLSRHQSSISCSESIESRRENREWLSRINDNTKERESSIEIFMFRVALTRCMFLEVHMDPNDASNEGTHHFWLGTDGQKRYLEREL